MRLATASLADLYAEDETAWLEAMAELLAKQRFDDVDHTHLAEYLSDMARRDRREVKSRLVVLLTHLLKWEQQPDRRTSSWRASIVEQRQELVDLARTGVLRTHAEAILGEAYEHAVERASVETGLPADSFPTECPYTIAELYAVVLGEHEA